jgi:zinc transporter 13
MAATVATATLTAVAGTVLLAKGAVAHGVGHQHQTPGMDQDTGGACRVTSEVWLGAVIGSLTVGLVGILPLFLISTDDKLLKDGKLTPTLRTMLGFACGGLLGNAFLHILPEAYATTKAQTRRGNSVAFLGLVPVSPTAHGFNENVYIGLWILLGIVAFIVLEKCVNCVDKMGEDAEEGKGGDGDDDDQGDNHDDNSEDGSRAASPNGTPGSNKISPHRNRLRRNSAKSGIEGVPDVDPAGYLNLLVNSMDNFTHGLAVAGSFCISNHVGIMTTIAIVIHEVPHEIGDYAILIRSGFSTTQAIRSQFLTSLGGLAGACFGLMSADAEQEALWILPFTVGGFLYISLCSLIPDMYEQETDGFSWWRDPLNVIGGIALIGATQMVDS